MSASLLVCRTIYLPATQSRTQRAQHFFWRLRYITYKTLAPRLRARGTAQGLHPHPAPRRHPRARPGGACRSHPLAHRGHAHVRRISFSHAERWRCGRVPTAARRLLVYSQLLAATSSMAGGDILTVTHVHTTGPMTSALNLNTLHAPQAHPAARNRPVTDP